MPKGYNVLSTLSPQQQTLLNQIFSSLQGRSGSVADQPTFKSGESYIQRLLGGDTEAFEAPLMRQFREQTIPGIAERFSAAGSGAQSSSAFQQALGAAGADLGERLGALRGGLQLQALPQALGYAQAPASQIQDILGLQTQALVPKRRSAWQEALLGLSGGLGSGIGAGLTGGFGGFGSAVLKGLGGLFYRRRGIDPDIQALIDYIG